MYIKQLYTGCISEAAYYIESNGESAIVDPLRDIEEYLHLAEERKTTIKYIFETHFHADFVSGHIDLAAATGGNTPLTKNNEHFVTDNGVLIVGNSNLPSGMPFDASKVYGKNVINFLQLVIDKDGNLNLNFEDDLVKGCCITHAGEVVHERVKGL